MSRLSSVSSLTRQAHIARPLSIGIRREDPTRIWERRAPLTPDAVNYLVTKNVQVHVEQCDRRVFPNTEYEKAGAKIVNALDDHIIVGIKETPVPEIVTSEIQSPLSHNACARTHLMFSHTIKGQAYNTPLLAKYLAPEGASNKASTLLPRLIDFELITNDEGKRTVGFGWFAGVAGVLESLSAMAQSHLEIGIATPFLYTPRPHTLPSLDRLRTSLREIGNWISNDGTPKKLGPFVIGLTGTGKVAQGCLSILEELPIVKVNVADLEALVRNPETDLRKIYLVHAKPEDYFVGIDGRRYTRDNYYKYPNSYISVFAEKVAPYLTLFLNGTGWSPSFPRLMTNEQLAIALERAQTIGGARFTNIGDISCDVEGGLEFLTKATTLSEPFYKVRPSSLPAHLPSIQMMSVDILPTSIPLDASKQFSQAFLPYLESLVKSYASGAVDENSKALTRATIAERGQLTQKHKWLLPAVDTWRQSYVGLDNITATKVDEDKLAPSHLPKKKRILLLGSGMVAGPAVDTITKRGDVELMIASNSLSEVQQLVMAYPEVRYRVIDMHKQDSYSHLVKEADVVISLLPTQYHELIAQQCIDYGKHLVTASYISDKMRSLHDRAIAADVLLLNEIGLDPGIDHCSAVDMIATLRSQGKNVVSFTSFCGGLPAPDVSHVPLRYKFSWRPAGVLTATWNSALFKLNNEIQEIRKKDLLQSHFPKIPITPEFELEGLANRDSLKYAAPYDLNLPSLRSIFRGTLRYPGFSNLMQSFRTLGLLATDEKIFLHHWNAFVQQCIARQYKKRDVTEPIPSALRDLIPRDQLEPLFEALGWLGLLPPSLFSVERSEMPALPTEPMVPLDIFAHLLASKLRYERGERDMVVLSHEVIARPPGPSATDEVHRASLITYGTPKASAMARTVGTPVAIAALTVLDGKTSLRGVHAPIDSSIYRPVLDGLEEAGLRMQTSITLSKDTVEAALVSSVAEHRREILDIPLANRYSDNMARPFMI